MPVPDGDVDCGKISVAIFLLAAYLRRSVAVPAAYSLAILSWNLLEKPFLKLKALFENVP